MSVLSSACDNNTKATAGAGHAAVHAETFSDGLASNC